MYRTAQYLVGALIAGLVLVLQGCAAPARLNAVPAEATTRAQIPELSGIRYVMPEDAEPWFRDAFASFRAELKTLGDPDPTEELPPVSFLAVSGGGDNGAYGAGLLCGWTAGGGRPEFKLVTGISTGALIAPFAFLGSKYDKVLRDFYTGVTPKDILEPRSFLAALFDDAMADNAPLRRLVRKAITPDILAEIAQEHVKGRVLMVATTNLDARRAVIWNMTKIAASGSPRSLELFQEILVASAAIPGAFPPVMIDTEVAGRRYQEMHVDGGAMAQVFVYPSGFQMKEAAARILRSSGRRVKLNPKRERTLYIIRNSKLAPDWSEVERRTLTIASRAVSSLIQTQGVGDPLPALPHRRARRTQVPVGGISGDFSAPHREQFDQDYMRSLFQVGYDLAAKGYPWEQKAPGM
jgi:predicted patatin/cPLA2 family phospholipase